MFVVMFMKMDNHVQNCKSFVLTQKIAITSYIVHAQHFYDQNIFFIFYLASDCHMQFSFPLQIPIFLDNF